MRGDGERLSELALSPDEKTVVAGDPAGNLFFFDTRTYRRIDTVRPAGGNTWVSQLAFSPDGRRLAFAHDTDNGNVVEVLDTRTRRRIVGTIKPPIEGYVTALRHTADDKLEFMWVPYDTQSGPALFLRHDARTGRRLLGPVSVSRRDGAPLLPTSDGRRLVTAGKDEVTVRDAATLRLRERFRVPGTGEVPWATAYALGPDDRTLAIGERDGALRFLDLHTGRVRTASGRHSDAITSSRFTPDGRTLITSSDDGKVIVWDVRQAAAGETLSGHANGATAVRLTRNGRTLYTAGLDGRVLVWDLVGTRRLGRPFKASEGGDEFAAALSPDGRLFARGQEDGTIVITDTRTLRPRSSIRVVQTGDGLRVRWVPGSRLLVVSSVNGFLAVVDGATGRVVRRLRGHRGRIFTPGISADGRLLVTGSDDMTVRFWSLPDGEARGAPLRFRHALEDAQLSPDGRWVTVVLTDASFERGRSRCGMRGATVACAVCRSLMSPASRGSAPTAGSWRWATASARRRSGRRRTGSR